jgi:E3 ubiquitin-protein ligase TRIP12
MSCCWKDVLAICGADLPGWCKQLVFEYKFLLPFPLRLRYFYCTAFGLARALHHLQQQQAAEGAAAPPADRDSRELRMGRIQRQKVLHFSSLSVRMDLCMLFGVFTGWR